MIFGTWWLLSIKNMHGMYVYAHGSFLVQEDGDAIGSQLIKSGADGNGRDVQDEIVGDTDCLNSHQLKTDFVLTTRS